MTSTLFRDLFSSSEVALRAAFNASSLSSGGAAPLRTCGNRENLVVDLFSRLLPVATRTIHGAVLVDAHGGHSGDVDVSVVAPWGAPVWPYQLHPLIPCEGVISGVFCEATALTTTGAIWQQIAAARRLFKSVKPREGAVQQVLPARTPNIGVWCWANRPERAQIEELADEPHEDLRTTLLDAIQRAQPDDAVWRDRVVAVGPHTPNWFFWLGKDENRSMFAFREHRSAGQAGDDGWNRDDLMPGLSSDAVTTTKTWTRGELEWRYSLVHPNDGNARPLRALIAYLSRQTTLYAHEQPHFGAYANP